MIVARGLAYLIDCACAFGLFAATQLVLFAPLRSAVGITDDWFRSGLNTELYTLLTISIPVWIYFAALESSPWQATLGKKLVGLRVVDLRSSSRIDFPRSVCRTVIKLLPWELAHLGNHFPDPVWYSDKPEFRVAFVFSGILWATYVIFLLLHPQHQCIHDILAKTRVTGAGQDLGHASSL